MPQVLNQIEEAHKKVLASVIKTGYIDVDEIIKGLYSGEVAVITGQGGLCESFTQNIILNQVKEKPDCSILVICPRMTKERYVMSLLSIQSEVLLSSITEANPPTDQEDRDKIAMATKALLQSNIQLTNNRTIPIGECFSEFGESYSVSTVKLIVVDDLESITFKTEVEPHPKNQLDQNNTLTRAETIAIIISYLNEVARKFHVPVLTTFDGSLDKLDRDSHDNVIEAYFNWADLVLQLDDEQLGETGLVNIDVRKCKHGQVGSTSLDYCDELACFDSMDLGDQ